MPLMRGKSKKAFEHNIETEMAHGKPQAQSLAIAFSVKRKNAKKKAAGGSVESGNHDMNMAEGGDITTRSDKPHTRSELEKGVNKIMPIYSKEEGIRHGSSEAGRMARKAHIQGTYSEGARRKAKETLEEMRNIKPKLQGLAEGGNISASNEKRPMPNDRYNDSEETSRNSGNKSPKNDQWTDSPTVRQAQSNNGRTVKPIKHPRMVPQSIYTARLRDEEDDLQSSASPGRYDEQPPQHDNEEGSDRQGPAVKDMADEHSTHKPPYRREIEDQYAQDIADADMKRSHAYASGGQVESSDYDHSENKYEHDFTHDTPSEDEGASMAHEHNEMGANRQGLDSPDTEEPHNLKARPYHDAMENEDHDMELNPAHDSHSPDDSEDQPHEEASMDHEDSIAAAIMSKRHKMALGGEILEDDGDIHSHGSMDSDDSSQVNLSRNADEDANEEDQASYDALRKENYSESEGLKRMGSPRDSNLEGDDEESESENKHDKIDRIRSKMNARRQFKVR